MKYHNIINGIEMLDEKFIYEANEQLLNIVDRAKNDFIQDINKIAQISTSDFKKNMYNEYSKMIKKFQLENIQKFKNLLNTNDGASENQILVDLASILFKSIDL